ncbi:hypothetical protein, conserved [Leishmania tarentolae]|uniref:Uncharacterized protein n=1 Tax=Leishmania tarentolae TaxID=5689 RepID=A0A640KMY7_LEITA|nr:hypothetical protein, conserved [Leishmania tarentolae]
MLSAAFLRLPASLSIAVITTDPGRCSSSGRLYATYSATITPTTVMPRHTHTSGNSSLDFAAATDRHAAMATIASCIKDMAEKRQEILGK